MSKRTIWIAVALLYAFLGAPHATAVKVAVDSADPIYWVLVRFMPLAIVTTPFIVKSWPKLFIKKAWLFAVGGGVSMTVAILFYTLAIKYSQASYVSIITLATPIVLVALSWFILKTSINRRAAAGVTLAALGAMVLVVLPIALKDGSIAVYPLATVLALGNSISFALAIIFYA